MKRIAVIAGITAGIGAAGSVSAWQNDVHYDLTRHLAQLAGYSKPDAATIAAADQGMDEDPKYNAIPLVINKILLGSDQEAEEAFHVVRQWHFASEVHTSGPTDQRPVKADAVEPRKALERCESLQSIGRWLHAYQDSWSHQGEPAVSWPFWRKHLQWGHPKDRDGPYNSNADLTSLHKEDAMQMAQASYTLLRACAGTGAPAQLPAAEERKIAACFAKDTKAEKLRCYRGSDAPPFMGRVHGLTLPDGGNLPAAAEPRVPTEKEAGPLRINAGASVPKEVQEQARALIDRAVRGTGNAPFGSKSTPPMRDAPSLQSAIVAVSGPGNAFDLTDLSKIEGAKAEGDYAAAYQYRDQPYAATLVLFKYEDGVLKPGVAYELGF